MFVPRDHTSHGAFPKRGNRLWPPAIYCVHFNNDLFLASSLCPQTFDDVLPSVVDAPPPVGFTSDDPPVSGASHQSNPTHIPRASSLHFGSGAGSSNGAAQVQHNIQHSIDDNCAVPLLAPLTPPGPLHKTISEQGPSLAGSLSIVKSNLPTNAAKAGDLKAVIFHYKFL